MDITFLELDCCINLKSYTSRGKIVLWTIINLVSILYRCNISLFNLWKIYNVIKRVQYYVTLNRKRQHHPIRFTTAHQRKIYTRYFKIMDHGNTSRLVKAALYDVLYSVANPLQIGIKTVKSKQKLHLRATVDSAVLKWILKLN